MSEDVARGCGITYRQLDWWCRRGWRRPGRRREGSGIARSWPDGELRVARDMGALIRAGVIPEVAARVARAGVAECVLALLEGGERGVA